MNENTDNTPEDNWLNDAVLNVKPYGNEAFEIQLDLGQGHSVQAALVNGPKLMKRESALKMANLLASAPQLAADLAEALVVIKNLTKGRLTTTAEYDEARALLARLEKNESKEDKADAGRTEGL